MQKVTNTYKEPLFMHHSMLYDTETIAGRQWGGVFWVAHAIALDRGPLTFRAFLLRNPGPVAPDRDAARRKHRTPPCQVSLCSMAWNRVKRGYFD